MSIVHKSYNFYDINEAVELVNEAERAFEKSLDASSEAILKSGANIVLLSGPSSSGKTTASDKLIYNFEEKGKRVKVISLDDFYFNREYLFEMSRKKGVALDFDSPDTIDFEYLKICVDLIKEGKSAEIPYFDFTTGRREGYNTLSPDEYDIIIFEGIQAIYNEFLEIVRGCNYKLVFISPSSSICADGVLFLPEELRLARRIVRDYYFRSSSVPFILDLWRGVRENEEKNIEPNRERADIRIDSTLAYEPCVIKKKLLAITGLSSLDGIDDDYHRYVEEFLRKFESVPSISEGLVPPTSVFREFIGGREKDKKENG